MRDGDPASVEGHVERPGGRLAEVLFVAYRVPHRVPVVVAHVQDGLKAQTPTQQHQKGHLGFLHWMQLYIDYRFEYTLDYGFRAVSGASDDAARTL